MGVEVETARCAEEQGEEGEEAQGPDARGGEVQVSDLADGRFLVLGGDGEKSAERHHFPSGEEEHAVARHHEEAHAGGEEPVEQAELAAVGGVLGLRPVTQAVDGAEGRDEEDLAEEHRREAVDAHLESAARHRPGQRDSPRRGRGERQRSGGHAESAGSGDDRAGEALPGAALARQEETRHAAQRGQSAGGDGEGRAHREGQLRSDVQPSNATATARM